VDICAATDHLADDLLAISTVYPLLEISLRALVDGSAVTGGWWSGFFCNLNE